MAGTPPAMPTRSRTGKLVNILFCRKEEKAVFIYDQGLEEVIKGHVVNFRVNNS